MKRVLIFVFLLAACKIEEQPKIWGDHLDPYMAARGYTVAEDGETILKNGYPVWKDPPCWSRGCLGSQPLVTVELASAVRADLLKAYKDAHSEYVADVSEKIGIKLLEEKKE